MVYNTPISIHAPREGGDTIQTTEVNVLCLFQSTPPARGATPPKPGECNGFIISIHAPREGGDFDKEQMNDVQRISIHAPREGGDRL